MDSILTDLFESVIQGRSDQATAHVQSALQQGVPVEEILQKGLVAAMSEVGDRFEKGEFYVPEMLIAARAMQAGMGLLRPHLIDSGVEAAGIAVLGTVKGDLHDIGKNLVAMMLEGAGFDIIDLGTDVAPQLFAETVREKHADIVGMSALLTTTMQSMKMTIEAIEDLGWRDKVKIMVGGAPLTEEFAHEIGADGYAPDASRAVALAKSWVK